MFEDRRLYRVVSCIGLPSQFDDKEDRYEEDILTEIEGPRNYKYNSGDSSDVFIGPTTDDFMQLQRDFYLKYGEHKELSQYVWETMHSTFPIASTSTIVSKLYIGEDEEINEPGTLKRQMETQFLAHLKSKV